MLEFFKMVGVGWLFERRYIVIGLEGLVDILRFIDKVEHKGLLFPCTVTVESGLRVCIIEDQYRFILHHQVMEKVTDSDIAVSIIEETKQRFPNLRSISYDKSFHSN